MQVLILAVPISAVLYLALYQAFLALGDFLKWVL